MILNELSKYYQRLLKDPDVAICEPGFSPEKISFRIVITKEGKFVNLEDLRTEDKLKPIPIIVPKFDGKVTSGIKPDFLWGKSHYTIGTKSVENEQIETFEHRKRFIELIDDVIGETALEFPSALAIKNFCSDDLEISTLKQHRHYSDFLNKFAVFEVQGTGFSTVFGDETILAKWRGHYAKSATGKEMEQGLCLVSGEYGSLTTTHPTIRQKITSSKSAKNRMPFISCNIDSGESYNKEKGNNAPVSSIQAAYFTGALNYLIDNNSQNILMGDTRVLFWAEKNKKSESFFYNIFDSENRNDEKINELKVILKKVVKGLFPEEFNDKSLFFVLGLSPNIGRISV